MLASANCSYCQKRGELPKIAVAGRERNLALAPRWWSNVKPTFYSDFGRMESCSITVLCAPWGAVRPALPLLVLKRCWGLGTWVGGGAPQTQAKLGCRQLSATAKDAPGASAPPGMQGRCSCSGHAPAAQDVLTVPAGSGPGHVALHRLHAWAAGCLLTPRGICCISQPLWPSLGKSRGPRCLFPLPPACQAAASPPALCGQGAQGFLQEDLHNSASRGTTHVSEQPPEALSKTED